MVFGDTDLNGSDASDAADVLIPLGLGFLGLGTGAVLAIIGFAT